MKMGGGQQTDRQTDKHVDIATYGLNSLRSTLSENQIHDVVVLLVY